MKILHINGCYDGGGGAETYLHSLCRSQKEMGHTVITISGKPETVAGGTVYGGSTYFINSSWGLRSGRTELARVLELLGSIKPDVVHFHNTMGFLSPMIVKAIHLRTPSVKTIHDVGILCANVYNAPVKIRKGRICTSSMGLSCAVKGCYPVWKKGIASLLVSFWEKKTVKGLDKIITGSHYMREELLRNSFPDDKISVLPLFPELNGDDPAFTALSEEEKILLFIGRLEPEKGVIQFIQALSSIQEKQWRADVVGDGSLFRDVQAMAQQMKLNKRITFHGQVPAGQVRNFYRRSYLVCMPSMIPESFGLVGVEAMAFEKPVVAFDSGGIREWLIHGETGYLVERGDIKGLAEKLSLLLEDQSLVRTMGESAKVRLNGCYRKETHLNALQKIYEEVTRNRAGK